MCEISLRNLADLLITPLSSFPNSSDDASKEKFPLSSHILQNFVALCGGSLKELLAAPGCFRTSFPSNSSPFDKNEDC